MNHYLPPRPQSRFLSLQDAAAVTFAMLMLLSVAVPPLRYLTYLIPVVALVCAIALRRFSLPETTRHYFFLFLCALALLPLTGVEGAQDIYLILVGVLPFLVGLTYNFTWKQIFIAVLAGTVISLVTRKMGGMGEVVFDPLASKSTFESQFSYVFGVLAIWAGVERKWGRFFLALLITLLSLKRIAVLGVLFVLPLMLMPPRWADRLIRPLPLILLNGLYLFAIVGYTQGLFDRLIVDLTNQSANQFGMGRQSAYQFPVRAFLSDPWRYMLIGDGPGSIYTIMRGGWVWLSKSNLHNDSLKLLIEYGGLIWMGFFGFMYGGQPLTNRFVLLYSNVLLLTDNTLIYPFVIFSLCLANQSMLRGSVPEGRRRPVVVPAYSAIGGTFRR